MVGSRSLGWELLGFGLIVGGIVIVSNKSPAAWSAVWGAATELLAAPSSATQAVAFGALG